MTAELKNKLRCWDEHLSWWKRSRKKLREIVWFSKLCWTVKKPLNSKLCYTVSFSKILALNPHFTLFFLTLKQVLSPNLPPSNNHNWQVICKCWSWWFFGHSHDMIVFISHLFLLCVDCEIILAYSWTKTMEFGNFMEDKNPITPYRIWEHLARKIKSRIQTPQWAILWKRRNLIPCTFHLLT